MKQLTLVICSILLLSSCHKDESKEFTSDVPDKFKTDITVYYYASTNITTVTASFSYQKNEFESSALQLPSNSYITVNGAELKWQQQVYQSNFPGKQFCSIEFKDYDGTIYKNTVLPVDTAHFINFPDTIPSNQDFEFEVNALILDGTETNKICLDQHGDDYGCIYSGTDSLITLSKQYLDSENSHILFLYRIKHLPTPNLPSGGGSIGYQYIVEKNFFSQ